MKPKTITIPVIPAIPKQMHAGLAVVLLLVLAVSAIFNLRDYPFNGNPFTWMKAQESYKDGMRLRTRWQLRQALGFFREAVAIYPEDAQFQSALGDCEFCFKHYPEAVEALKKTVQLDPKNAMAWTQLSRVYAIQNNFAESEKAVHQALKVAPRDPVASAQLGLLLAARGQNAEAAKIFDDTRHLERNSAEYWCLAGRYYSLLGKEQEAEAAFRQAVSLDATKPEYAEWLGLCLMSMHQHDEAEEYLETAVKLNDGDADYWESLGRLRIEKKNFGGAVEALKHAHDADPANISITRMLGISEFACRQQSAAEKHLAEVLSKNPGDIQTLQIYMASLFSQGKLEELQKQLEGQMKDDKTHKDASSWIFLADILGFQGKTEEARSIYKQALAMNPSEEMKKYAETRITKPPTREEFDKMQEELSPKPAREPAGKSE